ncbi:MAG: sigma-70 family RNA polymerase sigma factor [Myxococcales bacterium]
MGRPWRVHSGGVVPATSQVDDVPDVLDLESIHDLHADFVWCSLQRLGVRPADLEDALQEVFVVVYRKLASFDGSSRLTTWLFGISMRVASAYRRKAYRRRERTVVDMEATAGASPFDGPEDALVERQSRQRLTEVLDELEPARRAIFVMFEIESIGCPEIAEQLGLPIGTVYSRLGAARVDFSKAAARLRRREEAGHGR